MPNPNDPRQTAPQCHSLQPVRTVHRNPWFAVRNRGGYFTVEYNTPQVIILPIVDNRAIVMVRVKRPIINDITLELPAGGVEAGESPRKAARRELAEEAGISIRSLRRFKRLPPLVISSTRYPLLPYLFAINLSEREYRIHKPHDSEIADVECLRFLEIKKRIAHGEIYVSLPVAIVSAYLFRVMRDKP